MFTYKQHITLKDIVSKDQKHLNKRSVDDKLYKRLVESSFLKGQVLPPSI